MTHRSHFLPVPFNPPYLPKTLSLALLLAFVPAVQAQQVVLETIQVSGQRGSDTNLVVRDKRISAEQANQLQDVFKYTPEVNIGGGGLPVVQKLYVRGLGERMLSITIDGASQLESPYHHAGQVMIDPDLIKRVEVEAGTGAATAGPGALAGALRFQTKSASDLLKKDERAGAMLKAAAFSVAGGHKLSASVFGRLSESAEILASTSQLKSDDFKAGNGQRVASTAMDTDAAFIKFNLKADGGHRFALSHERNRDQGWRNKRSNLIVNGINPVEWQEMSRISTNFSYDYDKRDPLLNLHVNLYDNQNEVLLAQNLPSRSKVGGETRGLNVSNLSRIGSHKLRYGLDYRTDTGYASAQKDEQASVTGLYLQDDIVLTEQWLFGIGGRYDRYRYTDMKGRKFDSDGFSPSASLVFIPNEQLTVRLSHARALRGVGVLEPFLKAFQDNDPKLRAEKASNTEFGLQWQQGAWQINTAVFQQEIKNYIGYDDTRANLGTVKTQGYSASLAYQTNTWVASLGMSQAKPRINGVPLSSADAFLLGNSSGRTWVAQWDYVLPAWHLKFGWSGRFAQRLTSVAAGEAEKPGYGVHDVYMQWQPGGKQNFSVNLAVKNLLNRHYYEHSSFGYHPRWGRVAALPEAGRDVRVSASWRF